MSEIFAYFNKMRELSEDLLEKPKPNVLFLIS